MKIDKEWKNHKWLKVIRKYGTTLIIQIMAQVLTDSF
jgi:hypothetical protein